MAKGVKYSTLVITGEIKIKFHSGETRDFGNVANVCQEGDLFRIRFATGRIQKYPIMNIYEITEDWDFIEVPEKDVEGI